MEQSRGVSGTTFAQAAIRPSARPRTGRPGPRPAMAGAVLALQRQAGNAATARALQRDDFGLKPDSTQEVGRADAKGPFTSLPDDLQMAVVAFFQDTHKYKDQPATEAAAAKWFTGLRARQKEALVGIYRSMSQAGLWGFVRALGHHPGGKPPVDEGEPDLGCIEQAGNSVSVGFRGDADGLREKIGSPLSRNWMVDQGVMGAMHSGQTSVRQRVQSGGLHVSIGPADHFDAHIDQHPPVPAAGGEHPGETWTRLERHGTEELLPNMIRNNVGKVGLGASAVSLGYGLLSGNTGAALAGGIGLPLSALATKHPNLVPSIHLAPSMLHRGTQAWAQDNPAEAKALDPYLLEEERKGRASTGPGSVLSAGVGISGRF